MSHRVTVLVRGVEIRDWTSYEIRNDITAPPGTFSMQRAFDKEAYDALRLDSVVRIVIDGTTILTGFLERSDVVGDEDTISISGRDRYSRLEESAPGLQYGGLDLHALVKQVVDPWFPEVVYSNARNRKVARGKGKKAKAGAEPLSVGARKKGATRIDPGQSRAAVVDRLLDQTGYLAFASSDGREFIIGEPNHDQAPQYRLFRPAPNSTRAGEATVLSMDIKRSTEGRFSKVIVTGSGVGTDANYGTAVASRTGAAVDGPGPDGTGGDFLARKTLIVPLTVNSIEEAQELAEREMARRNAGALVVSAVAEGHGQKLEGVQSTIFVPDTIAWVEHERTGVKGAFLVVSCSYTSNRQGETTAMELVPRFTELSR